MQKRWLIFIVLSVFLISGANGCGGETVDQLKSEIIGKNSKIIELEEEIDDLKKQVSDLQKGTVVEVDEIVEDVLDHIDVSGWKQNDFVNALAAKSSKFLDNTWFNYEYRGDESYYYLGDRSFDKDSFFDVSYDNRKDRELYPSKLRIHALGFGNVDAAKNDYSAYLSNVDKALILDTDLTCNRITNCGNIKVVECTKGADKYHSWFVSTYLFEIRNDGDSLESFKEFYCI